MTDYFDFTISEPSSNPSFLGDKGIQYRGPNVPLENVPVGNIFCGITANQSGPFNKKVTSDATYYSNSNSEVQIFSSDTHNKNFTSWPPEESMYTDQGIPSQKSVWVITWPIRRVDGKIWKFSKTSYLMGIMVKRTPITWDSDGGSTWNLYLFYVPDDSCKLPPCPYDDIVYNEVEKFNASKNVAHLYMCDNTNCGSDIKCKYNPKQQYCITPSIKFGTAEFPCVPRRILGYAWKFSSPEFNWWI